MHSLNAKDQEGSKLKLQMQNNVPGKVIVEIETGSNLAELGGRELSQVGLAHTKLETTRWQ